MRFHPDEEGILDIEVMYDGTWMKRGYKSNIGIGVVTEAFTGFILDAVVFSKICNACVCLRNKLKKKIINNDEYEAKLLEHKESGNCKKNFDESSGKMEVDGAVELWGRSTMGEILEKKI